MEGGDTNKGDDMENLLSKDDMMENMMEEQEKPKTCPERYEGDKFIWDQADIDETNKELEEKDEIPVVKRDPDFEQTVGLRAHPDMTWKKCLWSVLVPWHNEWLNIWLYIGFAIYFWIEAAFIVFHSRKQYNFKYERNWDFMFIGTLSIAISLSVTAAYLILYSVSENWNKLLNSFDYMGKLVLFFGYTFAYVGSGLFDSKLYFPFMFIVVVVLIANLVVMQFDTGRKITFWISIAVLCLIYLYDFWFFSNSKEKKVFYIPMFVEGIILAVGYLLYYF